MSAIGFFDRGWRSNPTGIAYLQGATAYTFTEAGELSCRIAHALLASGLTPHAKIAVLAPNDPLAWICVLGIWRSGYTWIPANPASPAAETAQLLGAFDAELVIYHSSLAGEARRLRDSLPAVRHWVRFGPDGSGPADTSFAEWIAPHPATKPAVDPAPEDVVSLAPTGGTTGLPKGVMNTNKSLSAFATHLMMAALRLRRPGGQPRGRPDDTHRRAAQPRRNSPGRHGGGAPESESARRAGGHRTVRGH